MQPEDADLLRNIAQGDEQALRLLYLHYRPRLWRYLLQQLNGRDALVEDVLQEVFLAIWRSAASFRGEARVATWVFRIAHHHAVRFRLSADRFPPAPAENDTADSGEGDCAVGDVSPENEVVDRLILAEAFHRLSTKHRAVLLLVYQQGFTLDEAALILAIPAGTVRSRVSYARRALQRELIKAGALEGSP
jgi:RNA polymerase sigma-70 factor (ECF subfamily)